MGVIRRQLHVISESITNIKPASPTPLKLKQYNIPFHDRMVGDPYMPTIFFYSNPQPLASKTVISNLLKNSLSKTLSQYYPFAGRLSSSGSYVECNDEGIQFVEAKLNYFSCGGIAIAVSLSHRVADALTFLSFIRYWARLSRDTNDQEKLVHFRPCFVHEMQLTQSSYDDLSVNEVLVRKKHWITTEMVFPNSKIAKPRAELEVQDKLDGVKNYQNYTRNELVTALLYRGAVLSATEPNSGAYTKSVLLQTVNMRPLIDPPLPETSVGNLITHNHIPTNTMNEIKLNTLVGQIRKGKMQLRGSKSIVRKETRPLSVNYKPYYFSSICNFPLHDEMDFGWRRPVKAAVVDAPFVDCTFLMDTPSGDGINAIVALKEEDMKNLLVDKELLAYASLSNI
ncbi:hypothetical protein AgCh_028968 [Apium graveolens]